MLYSVPIGICGSGCRTVTRPTTPHAKWGLRLPAAKGLTVRPLAADRRGEAGERIRRFNREIGSEGEDGAWSTPTINAPWLKPGVPQWWNGTPTLQNIQRAAGARRGLYTAL